MRRCIFLVAGRRCGKTTLANEIKQKTGAEILGGHAGADSVKNRVDLYNLFAQHEEFILESHQVNNMPVIDKLIEMRIPTLVIFLNTTLENRTERQFAKTGKHLTDSQNGTHKSAMSFFTKVQERRSPYIETVVIDNNRSVDAALSDIMSYVNSTK
jgi:deoxyadenosine/deoxycytidine kinase